MSSANRIAGIFVGLVIAWTIAIGFVGPWDKSPGLCAMSILFNIVVGAYVLSVTWGWYK